MDPQDQRNSFTINENKMKSTRTCVTLQTKYISLQTLFSRSNYFKMKNSVLNLLSKREYIDFESVD
jgi:hypothetical protein